MSKVSRSIAVAAALSLLAGSASVAAVKKAPPKKPTTNHATVGTKQLSGQNDARFGDTYTLGKTDPWNITITGAEYSAAQLRIGERTWYPNAGQKLLVIHYNVHNPQKSEALMRYDTFEFTVVDSNDANWEFIGDVGVEKTQAAADQQMKPGQKMDLYTALLVPAASEMPKLIIKGSDNLVLRYDLRQKPGSPNKVKGLDAPFADPNDKTGATALETVNATPGVFYPVGDFDVRFDGVSTATGNLAESELEEGAHWLVLNLTARNKLQDEALLRYDTFEPKLADQDDADIEWNGEMLSGTRDKGLSINLAPGKEMKFRYFFQVASDVKPGSFRIKQGDEGRVYAYGADALK